MDFTTFKPPTELLWLGTIGTALAVGWRHVTSIVRNVTGFVIGSTKVDQNELALIATAFIQSKKSYRGASRGYIHTHRFLFHIKRTKSIVVEDLRACDSIVVLGPFWKFVWVTKGGGNSITIYGLRGLVNLEEDFIKPAVQYWNQLEDNEEDRRTGCRKRYSVTHVRGPGRLGKYNIDTDDVPTNRTTSSEGSSSSAPSVSDLTMVQLRSAFRHVTANPDHMVPVAENWNPYEGLVDVGGSHTFRQYCKQWYHSEEWHKANNIPWRHGILLVGEPGSGKTSYIRAVAQALDLPVALMDLTSMDNSSLTCLWRRTAMTAPVMIVFEDLDNVFHGRENVMGELGGGLSFDCLLNTIGGIEESNGVLMVGTVNDMSKIDPALGVLDPDRGCSTRPGRFDHVIHFEKPTDTERKELANYFLSEFTEEEISKLVIDTDGYSMAQVKSTFVDVARQRYFETKLETT